MPLCPAGVPNRPGRCLSQAGSAGALIQSTEPTNHSATIMAGDAPRRSTRASTSKRTYAESDGEEQQHSGKAAPLKTSSSSSKAKAAPKSRKPASKKVKKSADTIESGSWTVTGILNASSQF